MAATLEVLVALKERGLTRAIGGCNFILLMIEQAILDFALGHRLAESEKIGTDGCLISSWASSDCGAGSLRAK